MANTDETTICFTCSLVGKYTDLAAGYVGSLADILQSGIIAVFVATVPIWLAVSFILLLLKKKQWTDFIYDFLFIFIAFLLLSINGNSMISAVYSLSLELMGSMASLAFLGDGNSIQVYTEAQHANPKIVDLVFTVETAIRKVFHVSLAMMTSSVKFGEDSDWVTFEFPDIVYVMLGVALIVPYFLVLVVFFAKVVIAVFQVMMISLFSPIVLYCYAFSWGRGMGIKAIKTIFASVMILLASTAAMSMLVFGASQIETGNLAGESLADVWQDYLLLVALGWLGSAFMVEANGIANSLTDAVLSNSGTAVIVGGAAATAAGAASFAKDPAGTAGKVTGVVGNYGRIAGGVVGGVASAASGVSQGIQGATSMASRLSQLRR